MKKLLVFKYLVENKSDPQAKNYCGFTPLHTAAQHSSFEIVKYLVEENLVGKFTSSIIIIIETLFSIVASFHIKYYQFKLQNFHLTIKVGESGVKVSP
jgi:ankyrin repeat protein